MYGIPVDFPSVPSLRDKTVENGAPVVGLLVEMVANEVQSVKTN